LKMAMDAEEMAVFRELLLELKRIRLVLQDGMKDLERAVRYVGDET
jgi:hypothetical protein